MMWNKKPLASILLCASGFTGVIYGMARDHNGIFVIGILCLIGGYLIIRKRIKTPGRPPDQ